MDVDNNGGATPQVGHLPLALDFIEGATYRRCRCGMCFVLTPLGRVYWLRVRSPAVLIVSYEGLLRALSTNCRAYPRRPRPVSQQPQSSWPPSPTVQAQTAPEPAPEAAAAMPAPAVTMPSPVAAPLAPTSNHVPVQRRNRNGDAEPAPAVIVSKKPPLRTNPLPATKRGQRAAM
jgi:hypothetical protein